MLDPRRKVHDLDNLHFIDASFFSLSASVNPSLTILAQALRASEHLAEEISGTPSS